MEQKDNMSAPMRLGGGDAREIGGEQRGNVLPPLAALAPASMKMLSPITLFPSVSLFAVLSFVSRMTLVVGWGNRSTLADASATRASNPRGAPPPSAPSQSIGIPFGDRMETAKMFQPDPFSLKGGNFDRVVKALAGHARSTYNVLYHYHLLTKPKRWVDKLDKAQKHFSYFISKPEEWYESGAVGEFVAAMQTVPVVAVYLVRRLNVIKYLGLSTYNGRVAVFSLRALAKICPWRETVDLLPPEVRGWLLDPDVVVVTSGEKRTFLKKLQGIEITNQIDTERIFQINQEKGVIRPAVPAERGDLSWQLAYAIGYHPSTSRKNTWSHLVGADKFRVKDRDWPEWRMPGWQPDSFWKLEDHEEFSLYFQSCGPHIFISRLLRHGLVYGGMDAVVPTVPLKDCVLIFLQGAMEEPEVKMADPLALHSDIVINTRQDKT